MIIREIWSIKLEFPNFFEEFISTVQCAIDWMLSGKGHHASISNMRSCRGRAVRASDFHTGGRWFEPRPGSSVLGQGALSSLPSLSEETLSRRASVPCIGEKYPMHVKEPTSLLAKSREKSRWTGQTVQTGSYIQRIVALCGMCAPLR